MCFALTDRLAIVKRAINARTKEHTFSRGCISRRCLNITLPLVRLQSVIISSVYAKIAGDNAERKGNRCTAEINQTFQSVCFSYPINLCEMYADFLSREIYNDKFKFREASTL